MKTRRKYLLHLNPIIVLCKCVYIGSFERFTELLANMPKWADVGFCGQPNEYCIHM